MLDTSNKKAISYPRHGLSSWVNSKKLPRGRTFQAIRRELSTLREDLVRAHGGAAITPEARILCDSIIEAVGVQKILGLYVRQYGVIDGQAVKHGRLELSPIMGKNWISYGNVVRQGLLALKELEKGRQVAGQADIEAILTSYSRVDEPQEAKERAVVPVEARAAEDSTPTTDDSEET